MSVATPSVHLDEPHDIVDQPEEHKILEILALDDKSSAAREGATVDSSKFTMVE